MRNRLCYEDTSGVTSFRRLVYNRRLSSHRTTESGEVVTTINRTSRDNPTIQKFLLALVLVIGAFTSALTVPHWYGFIALALFAACGVASFCVGRRSEGQRGTDALIIPSLVLGLCIPLLNAYGSAALLSVTLLYLAGAVFFVEVSFVWAVPWLGILFFSAAAEIFWSASLVDWVRSSASTTSFSPLIHPQTSAMAASVMNSAMANM